jgi:protein phosphatase
MQNHEDNCLISEENSVLSLAVLSAIGDRETQQDCFGYHLKSNEGIVVVCDGMGGHEGGAIASNRAVASFLEDYEKTFPCNEPAELLRASAKRIDEQIAALKNVYGEPMKAGSTCVAVILKEHRLYWCSVGDSRAYLLRKGEFVQLTQDQNYKMVLMEKIMAGLITEEEAAKELRRGEALISYLGIGGCSLNDYSATPIELIEGDRIILMSDGLYKLVPDEEIQRVAENFRNIGEALRALETKTARTAKNQDVARDNVTIAMISIK